MRHAILTALAAAVLLLPLACTSSVDEPTPKESETKMADTQPPDSSAPIVVLETSRGDIRVKLWPDRAPKTVANFLQYVRDGFYDGTIFHRVIEGFMIQGGGFTPEMDKKLTREPIPNEASADAPNDRGTIAMARTSDPHSATAQFFINHADNDFLNHRDESAQGYGYAAFGEVVDGMDVVDEIAGVETKTVGMMENVPVEPILIKRAYVPEPD